MARYHINEKGEVGPCRAQKRCRFGGTTGSDNHYGSQAEAEAAAQERFKSTYGDTNSLRKNQSTPPSLASLEAAGVAVERVQSVVNHSFKSFDKNSSTVDLLEEKPSEELLKTLRAGQLPQFSWS